MANMKAVQVHNYGGPEVLRFEDAPRPTPGSGELLIKVHAASVNAIDWKARAGYLKDVFPSSLAVVLRCVGRIVAGDPTRALRDAVMCQVGKRLVVLDLAEVDTIDAAGLGDFIFLKTLACVAGMDFKLMNVTERVRALLNVTQLDSVFETWLPEDLEIRVSGAEKRSHLRQESSFATLHSSFEELFESTP